MFRGDAFGTAFTDEEGWFRVPVESRGEYVVAVDV
jgi:hypothetical protein